MDPKYGGGSSRLDDSYRTVDGKLEKSWLNFYANHPSWLHQESEQKRKREEEEDDENIERRRVAPGDYMSNSDLVSQLSSYQKEKAIASGSASFTAGNSQDINMENTNNQSVTAEGGMFQGSNSIMMPIEKTRFANAENYFYWLEEFSDSKSRSYYDSNRHGNNLV